MSVKYKMSFINAQEIPCVVNFIVDDSVYFDDPIILYGGPRPFVLSEFNQDSDFYKPIRPQQATIEILASAGAARLEAFITEDDDRQIKVRFDFGNWIGYWWGVVSQEDIQETWISQNHIITLRADEGFGVLKTVPLQGTSGEMLTGVFTPFTLIQYAATETVRTFLNTYIYSNLFHSSMNSGSKQTGIDQCYIDASTFSSGPGQYDDSYTVIEKINTSFNQTLFQYRGNWWIVRQEELYIPSSQNLTGFVTNQPVLGQRANANTRYTISVGVTQKVKPIMPEMIKSLNKPSKETKIIFNWDKYSDFICNQTFENGEQFEYTLNGSGYDSYSIVGWQFQYQSITTPVTPDQTGVSPFQKPARYVNFQNYTLIDDYAAIPNYIVTGAGTIASDVDTWLRSCNVYVNQYDNIDLDFQFRYKQTVAGGGRCAVAAVLLYATDGTKYSLNDTTRKWSQWTNDGQINLLGKNVSIYPTEWETFEQRYDDNTGILIEPIPKSGYINLLLFASSAVVQSNGSMEVKDVNFDITPFAQRNRRRIIKFDADSYTIDGSYKKNTEKEIYLSDSYHVYKGAIKQSDGFTLTTGNWFRRRYNSEAFTFKRQNAIANWFENRRYKIRLECNFFGLIWDKSGTDYPIGLLNTINFVDDLPTKTFAIVNLREIDFMNCTWTAELLEIWDDTIDDNVVPSASDIYNYKFYYE